MRIFRLTKWHRDTVVLFLMEPNLGCQIIIFYLKHQFLIRTSCSVKYIQFQLSRAKWSNSILNFKLHRIIFQKIFKLKKSSIFSERRRWRTTRCYLHRRKWKSWIALVSWRFVCQWFGWGWMASWTIRCQKYKRRLQLPSKNI